MKSIVAPSNIRVEKHTSPRSRRRIDAKTRQSVQAHGHAGRDSITRRLRELDREWDVERLIEANSSSIALGGTLLGLFVSRWVFALPLAVTAFLLQHAIQGWCPPIPILRRLGYRTAKEIYEERMALKALRGDFRAIKPGAKKPDRALAAARR
jgi:hypothetical protein